MSAWRKDGLQLSGGAVDQRLKPQILGGEKRSPIRRTEGGRTRLNSQTS